MKQADCPHFTTVEWQAFLHRHEAVYSVIIVMLVLSTATSNQHSSTIQDYIVRELAEAILIRFDELAHYVVLDGGTINSPVHLLLR